MIVNKQIEMTLIERYISRVKVLTGLSLEFIKFKFTGNQKKAENSLMWLKFFWSSKPAKVYKTVKVEIKEV